MKLFGNILSKIEYRAQYQSHCEAIFITGGNFNTKDHVIFRQLAGVASCAQSFMSAQKMQSQNFLILAEVHFSVRTTNKNLSLITAIHVNTTNVSCGNTNIHGSQHISVVGQTIVCLFL